MPYKKIIPTIVFSIIAFNACNSNNDTSKNLSSNDIAEYNSAVISNDGQPIKAKLNKYNISLFSNKSDIVADETKPSKGLVVYLGENHSETLKLQSDYVGSDILVKYESIDDSGEELVHIDDKPVILVHI